MAKTKPDRLRKRASVEGSEKELLSAINNFRDAAESIAEQDQAAAVWERKVLAKAIGLLERREKGLKARPGNRSEVRIRELLDDAQKKWAAHTLKVAKKGRNRGKEFVISFWHVPTMEDAAEILRFVLLHYAPTTNEGNILEGHRKNCCERLVVRSLFNWMVGRYGEQRKDYTNHIILGDVRNYKMGGGIDATKEHKLRFGDDLAEDRRLFFVCYDLAVELVSGRESGQESG
jgi:hypothetical protein